MGRPWDRKRSFVGVEEADLVGVTLLQFVNAMVVVVPVAADAFFTVLRLVLRKRARAKGIVVPAWRGLIGPVVGGQGKAVVKPFAETDDDFFPRPPQAEDANKNPRMERTIGNLIEITVDVNARREASPL